MKEQDMFQQFNTTLDEMEQELDGVLDEYRDALEKERIKILEKELKGE